MKLPSDIKAERGIIGCVLLGGLETAYAATEQLAEEVFFDDAARDLFRLIKRMAGEAAEIDIVTLEAAWRRETKASKLPEWAYTVPDEVPSPANLPQYAQDARRAFQSRRLVSALHPMLLKAQEGICDAATLVQDARQILESVEILEPKATDGRQSAQEFIGYLERIHNLDGKLSGIPTGFYDLDRKLCGLQFGEQTVIAARPSQGKTAIGLNIASQVCLRDKVPTLIVSAEMSRNALLRRMLSAWGRVDMNTLKAGGYCESVFKKIIAFNTMLKDAPLYILEACNGIDCHKVAMAVHKYARRHGVRFVVVDYLQKIKSTVKAEKRTYEVAEVSGELKAAAVKSNVALLTLAQLNRESEKDKGRMPRVSDLADSGQIERDADTVMLIHRPRTQDDPDGAQAKLVIGKNRDGETGIVDLRFEGKFCEFQNLSPAETL